MVKEGQSNNGQIMDGEIRAAVKAEIVGAAAKVATATREFEEIDNGAGDNM